MFFRDILVEHRTRHDIAKCEHIIEFLGNRHGIATGNLRLAIHSLFYLLPELPLIHLKSTQKFPIDTFVRSGNRREQMNGIERWMRKASHQFLSFLKAFGGRKSETIEVHRNYELRDERCLCYPLFFGGSRGRAEMKTRNKLKLSVNNRCIRDSSLTFRMTRFYFLYCFSTYHYIVLIHKVKHFF